MLRRVFNGASDEESLSASAQSNRLARKSTSVVAKSMLDLIAFVKHGGRGGGVPRLVVAQKVEGSKPSGHPSSADFTLSRRFCSSGQ